MYSKIRYLVIFVILCQSVKCLDFGEHINESLNDLQNEGMSKACVDDIIRLNDNLKNHTLWAMEMWEATAKEVSGSLHGTNYQLGNFDECLTPIRNSLQETPSGIARQYCLAKIVFDNTYPKNFMSNQTLFDKEGSAKHRLLANGDPSRIERDVLYSAMCVPAACTVSDLNMLLNITNDLFEIVQKFNLSFSVMLDDQSCQYDTTYDTYTTGSIVMICILCTLTGLVIISTILHWYTKHYNIPCAEPLKAFSALNHIKQLIKISDKDKELEIMYGIRVIAICCIIFDHRFGTTAQGPLANREAFEAIYRNWEVSFIYNTEIFVDTFFILSGLLTIYQLLKYSEKKSLNYVQVIFLRYVRLMSPYVFVIFLTATLLAQSGSGPLWNVVMEQEAEYCLENWWTNVLMISNYVNIDRLCMVHSWYIPCDFHFFILALVICSIMKNRSRAKIGLIVLGVIFCISIAIPALITYFLRLPAMLAFYNDFLRRPRDDPIFQNIYIKSHTRLIAYVMGLFSGYIVYKYYKPGVRRFSLKSSMFVLLFVAILYFVVIFMTQFFIELGSEYDPLKAALYAGFQRPIRCCITCLFLLICIFGDIPLIQSILSWTPCIILGKLTYSAYLIHMGLQLRMAASIRTPIHLSPYSIIQMAIGDMTFSFVLSFVCYLLIEGPVNFIIKLIFSPPRRIKSEETYTEKGRTNDALELDHPENMKRNSNIHTMS